MCVCACVYVISRWPKMGAKAFRFDPKGDTKKCFMMA